MRIVLLLSLLSPIVEAFPNLYMSWWAPSNGNIRRYLDTRPRRVAVVLMVWVPILAILSRVAEPPAIAVPIAVAVFSAFGLRLRLFDRYLSRELEAGTDGELSQSISRVPELLYLFAFTGIGFVLHAAVSDRAWLVPAAIGTIWLGAGIIARFRRGPNANLVLDRLGRAVFVVGFLLNLYNLNRAAVFLSS